MTTTFLARHATPDWGRSDLPYHIPPGPPLTAQGIAEAEALGEFLRKAAVWHLYVSPLERCLHTARLVAGLTGASQTIIPALIEVQPGETTETLSARLWPVFEQACNSAARCGPTALITHGGPIAILLSLLGMDPASLQNHQVHDNRNVLPPGGAWQVSKVAPGRPWDLSLVFPIF